jgi:hypothetical protein
METTANKVLASKIYTTVTIVRLVNSVDWIVDLSTGTLGISRIGSKSKKVASFELIPDIQRILNMAGVNSSVKIQVVFRLFKFFGY